MVALASPSPARIGSGRAGRIRPPLLAPSRLERPGLRDALAAAVEGRLTLLVAGAGFGKSTLAAEITTIGPTAWYTVDGSDRAVGALAGGVVAALRLQLPSLGGDAGALEGAVELGSDGEPLDEALTRARGAAEVVADAIQEAGCDGLVLVLDDLHELGDAPASWAFIESLIRLAPAVLHIVLASRTEPPIALERLRGQGLVAEIGAAALAFHPDEIEALLALRVPDGVAGADGADLALSEIVERIGSVTAGWPAAVRLAVEALRAAPASERADALARIGDPEGPVFNYLAAEVVAHATPPMRRLIQLAGEFDRIGGALAEAIGIAGGTALLSRLSRTALFVVPLAGSPGWYRSHDLIRDYTAHRLPITDEDRRAVHRLAAAWFERHALVEEALRSLLIAGDHRDVARIVGEQGTILSRRGGAGLIRTAGLTVPSELVDARVLLAIGEAQVVLGEFRDAVRTLETARASAAGDPALELAITWRLGVIYGFRGDWAIEVGLLRGVDPDRGAPADGAAALAWLSSGLRHLGERHEALETAREAVRRALEADDDWVAAGAHASLGLALEATGQGTLAEEEYGRAIAASERAGDVVQLIRARTSRGQMLIDQGRLAEAEVDLDHAARLASAIGFATFEARALAERGRARRWIGRLDEGLADIVAARAIYRRTGANAEGLAATAEGDALLDRGDRFAARAALEAGTALARAAHERHFVGMAEALLAEAIVGDDPAEAERLLGEAIPIGREMGSYTTLQAAALSRHQLGQHDEALALALESEAVSRARNERIGLARALELQALAIADRPAGEARASVEPDARRRALELLDAAASLWREAESGFGVARNLLDRALCGEGDLARAAAVHAEAALRSMGFGTLAGEAAAILAEIDREQVPEVAIRTLGGFGVLRTGHQIATTEWRSKKARDVLKILAARRGRPVPRETLFELLWPDEDPEPLANRLSVALATMRAVLDPGKAHPSDWFVGGDRGSLWLDLDHVDLDIVRFAEDADAGRRALRTGDRGAGLARLEAAERAYAGDFCPEDPFEDWASATRDELQATYVEIARVLAAEAAATDPDAATRYYLRVLENDPYDEGAHLGLVAALVAAGRHGEARRRHGVYVAKMLEIRVEAAPFEGASTVPRAVRPAAR